MCWLPLSLARSQGFHWHRPAPKYSKNGTSRLSFAPLNDSAAESGCASSANCTVWNYEDSQSVGGGFMVVGDEIFAYFSGNTDESQLKQAVSARTRSPSGECRSLGRKRHVSLLKSCSALVWHSTGSSSSCAVAFKAGVYV